MKEHYKICYGMGKIYVQLLSGIVADVRCNHPGEFSSTNFLEIAESARGEMSMMMITNRCLIFPRGSLHFSVTSRDELREGRESEIFHG